MCVFCNRNVLEVHTLSTACSLCTHTRLDHVYDSCAATRSTWTALIALLTRDPRRVARHASASRRVKEHHSRFTAPAGVSRRLFDSERGVVGIGNDSRPRGFSISPQNHEDKSGIPLVI
ncbi:hypothetical protein EVAR_75307_1 [Eumeta japonica]|uniref:Uncharacterized protein n=1 Tax=Eumeta variegata TaxID=151549 RepID=A0A4C1YYQ4_EUMVA|nr:hypothetical protein EVAR_75307_1 [Eumeta japonica]